MNPDPKKKLIQGTFVVIAVILLSYVAFQARNIVLGPRITIDTPTDGQSLESPVVSITGRVRNASAITLNDNPIFIDPTGAFREKLIAPPGYSIITMSVQDRFGRKKTKSLRLVLNSPEGDTFEMPIINATSTLDTALEVSTSSELIATSSNQTR
jgi:hypothetical protein